MLLSESRAKDFLEGIHTSSYLPVFAILSVIIN